MPTLVVHAQRSRETLLRVLSLFHKRALDVERMVAERARDSDLLSITITSAEDQDQARRLEANLWKLEDAIDVIAVHTV